MYAEPRNNFDTPIIIKYVSLRDFLRERKILFTRATE